MNRDYVCGLEGLITPINYLTGYLELAKKELKISAADFGLKALRKARVSNDLEGALDSLRLVNANIQNTGVRLNNFGIYKEGEPLSVIPP